MDRQTDRQTDGRTEDRQTDRPIEKQSQSGIDYYVTLVKNHISALEAFCDYVSYEPTIDMDIDNELRNDLG